MGLHILGPTFSALVASAVDMVQIATLAALANACAMYSLNLPVHLPSLLLCMTAFVFCF